MPLGKLAALAVTAIAETPAAGGHKVRQVFPADQKIPDRGQVGEQVDREVLYAELAVIFWGLAKRALEKASLTPIAWKW